MEQLPAELQKRVLVQDAIEGDQIGDAITAWLIFQHTICLYKERYPHWHFVRHEDLCRNYDSIFEQLYKSLCLPFGDIQQSHIHRLCGADSSVDHDNVRPNDIYKNSVRVPAKWQEILLPEEIERIKDHTFKPALDFYDDSDWAQNLSLPTDSSVGRLRF